MKMNLKRLLALVLALSMVLALAACGSSSSSDSTDDESDETETTTEETEEAEDSSDAEATETSSDEPVYGGDIVVYWNDDIDAYYDPAIGDTVGYNLFLEGLWSYDYTCGTDSTSDNVSSAMLKGQLADSWEWDEETATLTVTLRDDVYFQTLDEEYDYYGGRQLVADDVKWTYDRLTGQGDFEEVGAMENESNWASNLSMLVSTEVIDDLTVAFTLTSGDEVTLEGFMTQFVKIGGHEWDELTEEQQGDYHYACGTGPYILSYLAAGQTAVLVRNENYYDYDENYPENQLPYLDSITFLYVSDSTNLVTQFTSGEMDIVGSSNATLFTTSEEAQIAASGVDYYTIDLSSVQPNFLAMKCNQEPFDDINVRIAMQLAIDVETIHTSYLDLEGDVVLSGLWNPVTTSWSTVDSWDEELLAEYSYDPERAIELLEEAGYPDGFDVTVVISSDMDSELWTLACSMWAEIGVNVTLETVSTYLEAMNVGKLEDDNRSTVSTGAGACSSITAAINQTIDGGWAGALWNGDTEYAELLNSMNTVTTLEEQNEIALELDEYYAAQHWTVNLTGMRELSVYYSSRVHMYTNSNIYSGKSSSSLFSTMWVDAE